MDENFCQSHPLSNFLYVQSLSKTMATVCEVLTEEPDGGSAMIPVDVFVTLYQFLARLDCGPKDPNKDLAAVESITTITTIPDSHSSDQSDTQRKFQHAYSSFCFSNFY